MEKKEFKFHYVQMELIEEFFNTLDFQKFKFHYVQMEQEDVHKYDLLAIKV